MKRIEERLLIFLFFLILECACDDKNNETVVINAAGLKNTSTKALELAASQLNLTEQHPAVIENEEQILLNLESTTDSNLVSNNSLLQTTQVTAEPTKENVKSLQSKIYHVKTNRPPILIDRRPVAVIKINNDKFSFSKQYIEKTVPVKSTTASTVSKPSLLFTSPTKDSMLSDYKPDLLTTGASKSAENNTSPDQSSMNLMDLLNSKNYNSAQVSSVTSKNATASDAVTVGITNENNKNSSNGKIVHPPHVDLDLIEDKLMQSQDKTNKDLLMAISILQHHLFPSFEDSSEENEIKENEKEIDKEKGKFSPKKTSPKNLKFQVEVNEIFAPKGTTFEDLHLENRSANNQPKNSIKIHVQRKNKDSQQAHYSKLKNMHWFVLVMDGDCSIIRNRMSAFVTFLKAALSGKLSTSYEDIYVPSVYCDKSFMVNISLDTSKYPEAENKLISLAEMNTTLLEISGQIFYLEKILTKKSNTSSSFFFDKDADVEIVIYIAIGCMCVFILLSLVTVALIKLCRQADSNEVEKNDILTKINFPIRRPNVIYSPNFSHSLNPDKYPLNPNEEQECDVAEGGGVAPCSSKSSVAPYIRYESEEEPVTVERKQGGSSSKLKLLEEVQEEDEDEIDEDDYQDDDDDDEDDEDEDEVDDVIDDDDEDFIMKESSKSPKISRGLRSLCMSSDPKPSSNDLQMNFENPCYDR